MCFILFLDSPIVGFYLLNQMILLHSLTVAINYFADFRNRFHDCHLLFLGLSLAFRIIFGESVEPSIIPIINYFTDVGLISFDIFVVICKLLVQHGKPRFYDVGLSGHVFNNFFMWKVIEV